MKVYIYLLPCLPSLIKLFFGPFILTTISLTGCLVSYIYIFHNVNAIHPAITRDMM